jgi:D-beta-D-heptose 7-phosphate kinase / D-beta-D-heptose 1-phosphate adenosyltransferase
MDKIIFTNGCFDILHAGHLKLLKEAKGFGDILVVGLNSDNSVRTLKGKDRPINCQKDRKEMLLALKYVDKVIIFNELTPLKLVKKIKPNVLVKGSDWKDKVVVGSEYAGEVRLVNIKPQISTTEIIKKIRK